MKGCIVFSRASRRVALLSVLGVAWLVSCKGPVSAGEIKWAKSFDEAYQAAKEKNLPVMIDVYKVPCEWCTKLDKEVYAADSVVQLSEKFICVKLNPKEDKARRKMFKLERCPAIIFTDPGGKELHRIERLMFTDPGGEELDGKEHFILPDELVKEMKKALSEFSGGKASAK